MVENSQACWVRRMEIPLWIPCDSSWYSRTHLTGHGAQHCGQRILPCAASGMKQKEACGSRSGFQDMDQSPMARVTSECQSDEGKKMYTQGTPSQSIPL